MSRAWVQVVLSADSSVPHFRWWIALGSWPGFQAEMPGNALSRLDRRAGSGVDLEIGRWLLAGRLAAMAPEGGRIGELVELAPTWVRDATFLFFIPPRSNGRSRPGRRRLSRCL
jgi:hypothetical protein